MKNNIKSTLPLLASGISVMATCLIFLFTNFATKDDIGVIRDDVKSIHLKIDEMINYNHKNSAAKNDVELTEN